MRVAPAAIAFEIGVLLATPPSMRVCPSIVTGGNTPGSRRSDDRCHRVAAVSAISFPVVTSVVTTHNGMGASSSRVKRRLRAISARRWSEVTSESRGPGNRAGR